MFTFADKMVAAVKSAASNLEKIQQTPLMNDAYVNIDNVRVTVRYNGRHNTAVAQATATVRIFGES